jgi:tRNA pseudouridine13 synthase
LAALSGASVSAVGYAGLKDRHAVTEQWFSLPRWSRGEPDWTELATQGIEVLEVHPHRRKLRRGALDGNRFRIRIRDLTSLQGDLDARLAALHAGGVPNYFGEQRFGHEDENLRRAHALLTGPPARVDRHRRGLWLSAARSQLFNELLAERVSRADWDQPQIGDCLQLNGCHSFFLAERIDEDLRARGAAMDLHPSGPLWGDGEPPTRGAVHLLETTVARRFAPWADKLADWGLKQERRALRVPVPDLQVLYSEAVLELSFSLPSGAYATAVLRELIDWA